MFTNITEIKMNENHWCHSRTNIFCYKECCVYTYICYICASLNLTTSANSVLSSSSVGAVGWMTVDERPAIATVDTVRWVGLGEGVDRVGWAKMDEGCVPGSKLKETQKLRCILKFVTY